MEKGANTAVTHKVKSRRQDEMARGETEGKWGESNGLRDGPTGAMTVPCLFCGSHLRFREGVLRLYCG